MSLGRAQVLPTGRAPPGILTRKEVFVTGGTGYIGRPLIAGLLRRGHGVRALVRPGSESRLAPGAEPVLGNALDATSFAPLVLPSDTLIHLVGTPSPSPRKAGEFERVDLRSIEASVKAARSGLVKHLIYVSVAQPAPVMKAYVTIRRTGERLIRESGLSATILRPWYVLGPGHRWPYALVPLYGLLRLIPATRPGAIRLGLVTLGQMIRTLIGAVENPVEGIRILEVPEINSSRSP